MKENETIELANDYVREVENIIMDELEANFNVSHRNFVDRPSMDNFNRYEEARSLLSREQIRIYATGNDSQSHMGFSEEDQW